MLLISFHSYSPKDIINRSYNINRFAYGKMPDFVYQNTALFLFLSNDIENERIKQELSRKTNNGSKRYIPKPVR